MSTDECVHAHADTHLLQDAQRAPLVLDPFAIQKGAVGCVQVHQVWLNLQAVRPLLVTLSIPAVTFGAPQAYIWARGDTNICAHLLRLP